MTPETRAALAKLPGVREAAEEMADDLMCAMHSPEWDRRTRGKSGPMPRWWGTASPNARKIRDAHLTLLCDLTRPASRDWWVRWLSTRNPGHYAAWEITAAIEGDYMKLCGFYRAIGLPEPERWEPHPDPTEALAAACIHVGGLETP